MRKLINIVKQLNSVHRYLKKRIGAIFVNLLDCYHLHWRNNDIRITDH